MVYIRKLDLGASAVHFDTGILENWGFGVVFTSFNMLSDSFHIRMPGNPPVCPRNVSIVICTYGRPESLNDTLESLTKQTYKNFEVVLVTEKGNLAELRQKGLVSSSGRIVSFIDDDVYCPPTWLQGVVESFGEGIVGVSGPTTITQEYLSNRDCFKYKKLRRIQEWVFNVPSDPGKLSHCGAPSMASNDGACKYEGEVQYLECCNMSVRREDAINVRGFDSSYYKTSEWSEVDLSLRLGKVGKLVFRRNCGLYHRPSKAGVYRFRLSVQHRWDNFTRFQKRWVKSSLRRHLYWAFIWTYFKLKEMKTIR